MPNVRVKIRPDVVAAKGFNEIILFPGIRKRVADTFGILIDHVDVEWCDNAPGCDILRPMVAVSIDIGYTPERSELAERVKDELRDRVRDLLPIVTKPCDVKVTIKLGEKHVSTST
ncbi:MAG TPA: hypothetical protein VI953_03855 [Candidatus Paceibacterota bacterium]